MPPTLKAAEAFKPLEKKNPPLVTLLSLYTSIEDILHYYPLHNANRPKALFRPLVPLKIVFCSRLRNYHLLTRVRHTRLLTSVLAPDWSSKGPPSSRGALLVVSRGLREGPFIREGSSVALDDRRGVRVLVPLDFFAKNVFFGVSERIQKKKKRGGKQWNKWIAPPYGRNGENGIP